MIVGSNVGIPTSPLLPIERALALLKPGVLEKLKRSKDEWQGTDAILFRRTIPILDNRPKGARQFRDLDRKKVHQRVRQGIDDYCPH